MRELETQPADDEIGRCHICTQTLATRDDLSKHLMEAHGARALKALNELAERYGKQFPDLAPVGGLMDSTDGALGTRSLMRSGVGWDVIRTGRTVRIDVNAGVDISEDAGTAIIAASMEHMLDEDVSVIQLDGSALVPRPPKGLTPIVAALELLAERYGKELIVGPI